MKMPQGRGDPGALHFEEVVRSGRLVLTPLLRSGSSPEDLTTRRAISLSLTLM
jgi:hypothetical protein